MFTITFYEIDNNNWTLDIVFTSYDKAKSYLINQNYKEDNRWFKRESNGWYFDSKAIINKVKVI